MNPAEFAAKWRGVTTSERASAQSHFIDLCQMLGEPTPSDADPTGSSYAFEKGAEKLGGGDGFADVWKRGLFGWEYKGQRADLRAAYKQLVDYKDALENPPYLVVSDLDRIEVKTNYTGLSPVTYTVTLDDLDSADPSEALRVLRAVFNDPTALRPRAFDPALTEAAARRFAELAGALQSRGHDPQRVAHFLNKLLFCLFAEDAGLLPKGLMVRLADVTRSRPAAFAGGLSELFAKMAAGGGLFGVEEVHWFNGGLFDSGDVLELTAPEIGTLLAVGRLDWSKVEPAIFGTLFERGLDPSQRAQLGAHYTDRAAIERLVYPVVIDPLRREYRAMQSRVEELLAAGKKVTKATKPQDDPTAVFSAFLDRLRHVRILDPACGSGNFLYIALQALKDLELEAIHWGSLTLQQPQQFPQVGPETVMGIEINAYAAELARVTIWIGEIQWMLNHGFAYRRDPILRPLHQIRQMDALLDLSDPSRLREAEWPAAEFIVGNPPFLGGKLLRSGLGDRNVDDLFEVFDGRVPREADFVTYWHEKARAQIERGLTRRAGLLATQGIRGGANRRVLGRIKETGDLFFAYSDQPWVLNGANVHISFIGQDNGSDLERSLNGQPVAEINTNLTAGLDLTRARRLKENLGISFMADTKGGPFDIPGELAASMLAAPNPDGRPNRDVVRPWVNGLDLTRRPRGMWIIDFGARISEAEAALYEAPFEYVREHVMPERVKNNRAAYAERWWLHIEPRSGMRAALAGLGRYIATPNLTKHRLFAWLDAETLADHQLIVFARDDDYTFGVLHARVHELWARATGTQLREVESGFRYTPTTCFETFPFPRSTDERRHEIGAAARRLVELRDGWLNPSGLSDAELAERTLTNLYNQRPTWLDNAHHALDTAVLDAYGWHDMPSDEEILARLLALNLSREPAAGAPSGVALGT